MRERKPNRLNVWNYDSAGYYYITINTVHFIDFFGQIKNDKMEFSEIGRIARQCWIELPDHYNYILLDEFIIMPNHFHGIIRLLPCHGSNIPSGRTDIPSERANVYGSGMPDPYEIKNDPYEIKNDFCDNDKFQYKRLPIIIGSYKSAVSKLAHKKGYEKFGWHKSYYDHIVRNKDDLNRIQRYIINNPVNYL